MYLREMGHNEVHWQLYFHLSCFVSGIGISRVLYLNSLEIPMLDSTG